MKTKIIAGIGIAILAVALIFTMKPKSFSDEFAQTMKDMDSYILQGNMEITKGEDVKAYALEVGYEKGEKDYFKVSLTDKELNQDCLLYTSPSPRD